jgi:hypothetical protein
MLSANATKSKIAIAQEVYGEESTELEDDSGLPGLRLALLPGGHGHTATCPDAKSGSRPTTGLSIFEIAHCRGIRELAVLVQRFICAEHGDSPPCLWMER